MMDARVVDDERVREALTQLAGSRGKGQKPEPAWFHPFPARMPVSVAEHLVSELTRLDAVVADPMVGSGTTAIAGRRLGRQSFGFDRDPLALLIARSATRSFDSRRLDRLRSRILDGAESILRSGTQLSRFIRRLRKEDHRFIEFWFPKESQEQLFALARAIEQEANGRERDFAWVVFSALIISKSAGASLALDLSHSRPHRQADKAVVLPFDDWDRRFTLAVTRLPFIDREPVAKVKILRGDARDLRLSDLTVDFVLTSPPYLHAIDYLRAHKFSLVWMGHRLDQLRELRASMVGTERGLWNVDGLPPQMETRLDRALAENRPRAQRRRYLSDLNKILGEIARVLRPGGLAILVMGPRIISSARSDAARIIGSLGQRAGLRLVGTVDRELSSAHRYLPPPQSVSENPLAHRMSREVIVALRK